MNVCRYHCDWRERIKTVRLNPNRYEMPESVRTSMASVYYDKYDINCQQVISKYFWPIFNFILGLFGRFTEIGSCGETNIRKCYTGFGLNFYTMNKVFYKGIEINVSYKELTEKLRENLGNPSDWRPSLGIPVSTEQKIAILKTD